MPGRLMTNEQGAVGSQDLKKDRSQAQIGNLSQKRDLAQMQGAAHTNGNATGHPSAPLPNGLPAQKEPLPTTNGRSNGASAAISRLPTPPPLDQSWRTSDSNRPFGVLLARQAQLCFGELGATLDKMNDMPVPQPAATNGALTQTNDSSQESQARKRLLMTFAQDHRDRFIKALILSDWARNEKETAKLVDLKTWLLSQMTAQDNAMHFIGITKHDVARAKMPNPNIEGAMELLASGKAPSKWPDLGYIPPPKLTAKQLTNTLLDMNVALATRLNLHEDLPQYFRDFSIANGRATFRVPGEFEVDLSVADEDPSSQFYLIDLRFSFTPAPALTDDVLRNALEAQTNEALNSRGLLGCYEFLHNFVLTHKITVLKSQSVQLFREKWFNCLVTETQRRVLAIQYWKDQSGKKSWIEFGISTGKSKGKQPRRKATSQHSIRWFRQGQEVHDQAILVDWSDLDLDAILSQVTAKHASWSLCTIHDRLQALAGPRSKVLTQLSTSECSADDCNLTLSLSGLRSPIAIKIETVTGLATISPSSRDAATAQRHLNRDPSIDSSGSIAQLLCRGVQDKVRKMAVSARWQLLDPRCFGPQPNFRTWFGSDFVCYDVFACNEAWGERWLLCTTYSLTGQKWWVVQINQRVVEQGRSIMSVVDARPLDVTSSAPSRADLLRIKTMGEAEVSFAVLVAELGTNKIPYHLENLCSLTFDGDRSNESATTVVYIRMSPQDLKKAELATYKPLAMTEWIRIVYDASLDENEDSGESRHDIRLTLEPSKLKHLKEYLCTTQSRDGDVAMNASGGLALSLRAQFGQPYMKEIVRLLKRCRELDSALSAARRLQYTCTTVGLRKLAFTYGTSQQYNGVLASKGASTTLRLGPTSSNPHQRIRIHLEEVYNRAADNPFFSLTFAMSATQPFLEEVSKLEAKHTAQRSLTLHTHHVFSYSLVYHAPLAPCRFTIMLHWDHQPNTHNKTVSYTVTLWPKKGVELAGDLTQALIDLSKDAGSTAEGWLGNNKGGFTSNAKGLHAMLQRLDDFMLNTSNGQDDYVTNLDKQETPLPEAKPPLNRNSSKSQIPTQQKPPTPAQLKNQPRLSQNQMRPGQDSTARQMTVPAAHVQRPNQNNGGVKQEIIELD
ncbi:Mediator of RNA polymerase II transcription subunit 14 [Cercospora zeina]